MRREAGSQLFQRGILATVSVVEMHVPSSRRDMLPLTPTRHHDCSSDIIDEPRGQGKQTAACGEIRREREKMEGDAKDDKGSAATAAARDREQRHGTPCILLRPLLLPFDDESLADARLSS